MRNRLLGIVRLLALFAGVVVFVWLARPERSWVLLGFPLLVVGESIRWWAAGHLLKSEELVTSGPYAYTQNPLYLGRLFILRGLGVMCTLPWGLNWVVLGVGLAGFFGYYMPRKLRVEGTRLEGKHGDRWQRYRHSVPVLFPSPGRYPDAERRPWAWGRMVRNREYLMVLGLGSIVLLLWFWIPG